MLSRLGDFLVERHFDFCYDDDRYGSCPRMSSSVESRPSIIVVNMVDKPATGSELTLAAGLAEGAIEGK